MTLLERIPPEESIRYNSGKFERPLSPEQTPIASYNRVGSL